MATAIAVRFPLGRYHATAWDRSVNEGEVEWPPSPWRLLRALLAVWYTRWPDLPAQDVDDLLAALGDPPSYLTPPTTTSHSRHYMPDADHSRGETGRTDLVLDPFIAVPRDADLIIRWNHELTSEQRTTLGKLVELLPYLGRAESLCEARLLDDAPALDARWWQPVVATSRTADFEVVRRLAPSQPFERTNLEARPLDVRKARRTLPEGSTWVEYVVPTSIKPGVLKSSRREVTAVLLALSTDAPFRQEFGVLAADVLRRAVLRRFDEWDVPAMVGRSNGAPLSNQHDHAHWLPLAESGEVHSILVWVPAGMSTEVVSNLLTIRDLRLPKDRQARGFRPGRLSLAAAGSPETVVPELVGPARSWVSAAPYLPVRHRKRESMLDFVSGDVRRELGYRGLPVPEAVALLDTSAGETDDFARPWRRYRLDENMGQRRSGLAVSFRFSELVSGPITLGSLSHFGFGLFQPITG